MGTWNSPSLDELVETQMNGKKFDVVLADYLVGAMEGFTPYEQDLVFSQLKKYVGKELYVVGQEPYSLPHDHGLNIEQQFNLYSGEELSRLIAMNVMKLRDSTLLLTNERFYR